jgi:2'-5' RNA ligase
VDAGAFSAVVIPVREAETIVRQRVLQVQPELIPRDRSLSAHITLLAPFLPPDQIDDGVIADLARFFADVTPFGFTLGEVCEFPDGPTYLAPDPAAPIRKLTQELHRSFPEFPPYGGAFDDVVPHLTVPLAPGEDTDTLRISLNRLLPMSAYVTEATLVHVEVENLHVIATLPFANTAA